MTEFQNALARFLQGQLDLAGLEAIVLQLLSREPARADEIVQTLDQLFRSSRLSAKDYIALKQAISDAPPAAAPEPPSAPEPPPAPQAPPPAAPEPPPPPTPAQPTQITKPEQPSAPPESTQSSSDILDILQSGSDSPPEPPAPTSDAPADDKTVFRQSAPAPRSPAQSSVPQTGTGHGQQTGPTGGISRPTAGPSIPTGTGSNWTDPSRWGDGPAPTMQPGSILKDRYVLETVIGRGGMGVVFKAKDLRREEAQDRNPHIAVKILNDEFRRHPESLKALQRESRKAQDLAHPNIVTVFDFDRDGQTVYMTMEFLEGQSLDRVTKSASFDGMPLKEAYPLIEGLGRALAYAHNKGVVHSDFKPANTFLTKEGVIKVFDFGIARAAKLPGQQSGEMTLFDPGSLGALTPAYASCEMIDGEEPDPRDDIYALACLAYELLAGRHPFDKRSATEARDKGLTVKPIKGLSRRNWRGLQRGLAFRREDRSPTIEVFLDDLKVRKLNKTAVGLAAAAGIALVAVVAIQGPAMLEERRINSLITAIVSGQDAQIPGALEQLDEFGPEARESITTNSQVEDRLIDYFDTQIQLAINELDFPRAEALLAVATSYYDDSSTLFRTGEDLKSQKAALLAELNARYNENLQAGRIMPSDGEDITKVLTAYEQIDPNHPALTDPQLAIAYADLAEQLLTTDVLQAGQVVDEARLRFPDDPRLRGLNDRVTTLRETKDIELRVAELEQQLSGALAAGVDLADVQRLESAIVELGTLEPASDVLAGVRGRLQTAVSASIDADLGQNDWTAARATLDGYSRLLSQDDTASLRSRIDAAASDYDDRVGGVYASVADAVQRGNLEQATSQVAQLEQLNAAPGTIRQAREMVTRGYLSAAQTERSEGRYDAARELIRAGQSVDPAYPEWQAELDATAEAERLADTLLAEQERERLQQEKASRIAALNQRIRANLNQSPFGIETARETLDAIDELSRQDAGQELARNGRREVAAKLAMQARGLGIRDQDFEGALALVDQSLELLPAEQALRQAQSEIRGQRDEFLARAAAEQAEELRATLERLLAAPAYDAAWEAELRRAIQGLEPMASNADYVRSKRREVADLYVVRAKALRAEERFSLAERMLQSAEWFVSDYAPADQERTVLADARQRFDEANRERQLQARIDGLKRTFETELNAERFPDARRALATLADLLPSGDPFVVNEAPRAIADTYSQMASRAFASDDFDRAERLARSGLNEVSNHEGLTRLLAEIRPRRLAKNRADLAGALRNNAPTDAAGPRNLLAKIRSDAGSSYPEIEAELKDIADQRVAGSKANRDQVVAWVGGIIEGYTAPPLEGTPCSTSLAGYGSRGSRGQCFDYLPGSSEQGPRLVVIPAGGGIAQPFAIARQELSVGQWNAYCRLSNNCSPRSGQGEQLPITNISVSEANDYASWLSTGTKHTYRLPTAQEWTHAATATGSAQMSPNCINPQAGLGDVLLEVNRGGQNAWGIQNFVGNAQEWVVGPSGSYEARGGAFNDRLGTCGIGLSRPHAGNADGVTGFRLVRELGEDA